MKQNFKAHALAAIIASSALWLTPAMAHVSLEKPEAPTGSYKAVLKVPHGCEGSPTHTVRVTLPEGFIGAKPMPKPTWTVETTKGAYAKSYDYLHGKALSEGVKEVVWRGGNLPSDFYDEFVISGSIAKELAPGTELNFLITQECEKGRLDWNEIAKPGEDPHALKAPAPRLTVIAKTDKPAASASQTTATYRSGDITVETPWTRATPGSAPVAAAYLKISNSGPTTDTLQSVSFAIAGRSEIHEMTMTDGIMKMRQLAAGLEIPANGAVTLAPGGTHLMLMDLKEPVVEGKPVRGELTFKSGAKITIDLTVAPLGAAGPAGDHSQH